MDELTDRMGSLLRLVAMDKDQLLMLAVEVGDEEQLLSLLNKGADVKKKDSLGFTTLHRAVITGHHRMIKPLMKYCENIGKEMARELRPIIHSLIYSKSKRVECLMQLVEAKIRLDTVDYEGNTVLHRLMKFIELDVELIEKLLFLGMDPGVVNLEGNNCLHILVHHYGFRKQRHIVADKFLQRGLDINATNSKGETALHIAVRRHELSLLDFLLRKGASIDLANKSGFTLSQLLLRNSSEKSTSTQIFLKHVVLRQFRRELKNEDQLLIKINSNSVIQEKYQRFVEDLERLKTHRVDPSYSVTFFDILCRSRSAVAKYLKNPGIRDFINVELCRALSFRDEIAPVVDEAMVIYRARKLAYSLSNAAFRNELSHLCIERISNFFVPLILAKWKKNGVVWKSIEDKQVVLYTPFWKK